MNKENFELWLRDLETTDEPQIQSTLTRVVTDRNSDKQGDCCLGRMCKVAIANGAEVTVETDAYGYVSYDDDASVPPVAVQEWLGVREQNGGDLYALGMSLNDNGGLSFKEIAAKMREEYGGG